MDKLLEDLNDILAEKKSEMHKAVDELFESVQAPMQIRTDQDGAQKFLVNFQKFINGLDISKTFMINVVNVKYGIKDQNINKAIVTLNNSVRSQIDDFTETLGNLNQYIKAKLDKLGQ